MAKSPEAFRTISEVADWLETPAHVLRFWESKFAQVKPVKRAGGRRYYRPDDMALLGGIKVLLHEQGMTIKGAQKLLREKGVRHVMALGPPLRPDDASAEPVRMPPPRRAPARPARPDVEDAEIVPDAPFEEAEPAEAEPEGMLVSFPGPATEDEVEVEEAEDDGALAIGPGFERALGKARQREAGGEAGAARPRQPGTPEERERLPDLVDMADAAVAGPPAADSQPAVTPEPQGEPGLLGALMRVERRKLGHSSARLTGPAGRLAAIAERLSREHG